MVKTFWFVSSVADRICTSYHKTPNSQISIEAFLVTLTILKMINESCIDGTRLVSRLQRFELPLDNSEEMQKILTLC